MSDYISRDAAIHAANRADDRGLSLEDANKMSAAVVAEIENLPAADVKPVVRGKWIYDGDCLICSHCRTAYTFSGSNYCPNCGADMRGEQT